MAEKYGTIPKKFTKEWWDYFWTYYKWHVIAIVALIIVSIFTIYQKITTPKYDVIITYAGTRGFSSEQANLISENATPLCPDVDNNGEKALDFRQINIPENDFEYASNMLQKLNLTLSEEKIYIYICDAATVDPLIGESPDDSTFIPLDDWCSKKADEAKIYSRNGVNYGIELTECDFFSRIEKDTNADFSGNYLFIRYYPRKDQIKEQLEGYNAAKKVADRMVTGK